jgi:type II secretory pathway pseudopilin PulG
MERCSGPDTAGSGAYVAVREPGASGIALVESLVALFLVGMVAVAIMPALVTETDSNRRNEVRSAAVSAVQQRFEELRLVDPATLPTLGTSAAQAITIGDWQFDVVTRYCTRAGLCNATSRHLTVEARLGNRAIYDAETVFTQIQ